MLLTGTPLQNTVEELFSLLHFLEPLHFPAESTFMQEFGDLKTEEQVLRLFHYVPRYKKNHEEFSTVLMLLCNLSNSQQ